MRDIKLCSKFEKLTDQEILNLLKTNEDALECLYIKHRRYCLHFLVHKGASLVEAEDLYQDAIIVLIEKIRNPEFVLTSSFQTYLNAVCFNKLRAKRGSKEEKETVSIGIQIEESYDWYDEEDDESKEKLEKVLQAYSILKKNGDKCYERLQLFYFEKMSNAEIAHKLGLKDANTTKNLINRCRDTLKKMIGLI